MKNTIKRISGKLACMAAVIFSFAANGQEAMGRHEVGVGTGVLSCYYVAGSIFSDPGRSHMLTVHYRYHKSADLAFGLGMGAEVIDGTPGVYNAYYTVAPEVAWVYYRSPAAGRRVHVALSGSCALGLVFLHEAYAHLQYAPDGIYRRYTSLSYQATPLEIRVGNAFGVYGALGLGYKGIFSLGCDFRMH